jgi:hypothetical protein
LSVSFILRSESPVQRALLLAAFGGKSVCPGTSLSELLYHFYDGCDRSLGLINHDAVTALVCKELLTVR